MKSKDYYVPKEFRLKVCRCGKEFETKHSRKSYCTTECQLKYSRIDAWNHIKTDYRFRCRRSCNQAKARAKQQNLDFNIDTEYLIELWEFQDGCCAISGRELDLSKPEGGISCKSNAPSLDRIIPNLGYTKGNVRFVCYQVNTALNEYGETSLISLCKDIIKYQGGVI